MHNDNPPMLPTVFDRFGGIRPMAAKVGAKPSTVMSWKRKGEIPRWWRQSVIDAASECGIDVSDCPEVATQTERAA